MNKKVWCINVADAHRAGICVFLIEKKRRPSVGYRHCETSKN